MALFQIPTTPYPSTTQQSDLDGTSYSFRFRWSERGSSWHMDLYTLDGDPVALSVRLVTEFPLLRRNVQANRPRGELVLLDMTGQGADADLENFGTRFAVFYLDAAELGR